MKKLKLAMNGQPTPEQTFIMDSLAKFFTYDKNRTFADSQEFFEDHGAYGSAIRKLKPEKLDKETVKEIAFRVNQDENGKVGDVQNFMVDVNRAEQNLAFYPHFKLLFKITQMSVTVKKREGLQRKIAGSADSTKNLDIEIETWTTISKNLDFGNELKAEAERMGREEIDVLKQKHAALNKQIENVEKVIENFATDYFAELTAAEN